jgi:hypothetical protein
MSAPTPTAGRPGRIITIADVERFHRWTHTGEAVDPDEDLGRLDVDSLIDDIRTAGAATGEIKPSRLQPRKQ